MTTTTPAPALTWHRDSQGLHATIPGEPVRLYVRRDGKTWRLAYCDLETVVAGGQFPTGAMTTLDHADTQAMAKAVGNAFAVEPWSDGGPQRRITRAILRAYATA